MQKHCKSPECGGEDDTDKEEHSMTSSQFYIVLGLSCFAILLGFINFILYWFK